MQRAKKVALVWYCKTGKGWRRFPVVLGANNRIKHGYVWMDKVLTHVPKGRYEIRSFSNRKLVYRPAGATVAEATEALRRESKLEAVKVLAEDAGVVLVQESSRVNLKKAASAFEQDATDRGALEAAEVNRNVTKEFLEVTNRTYADEITRDDVFRYHKYLRGRGWTERTVSNKHKRLRSFLIFCKLDYAAILPPTPKYDATVPDTYEMEERTSILKVADSYMRIAIELGLMCGLRDQEIQHLEWKDIRWSDSTLRVTSKPQWNFKIKDSEERDIPIPSSLLERLRVYRVEHPDSQLVLPTIHGNPNSKLLRSLKRLAKANGLNCGSCKGCKASIGECREWTLHKLRRTYGTTLLRSGLDLATVQKFMGHSDLASTMRYLQPATTTASQAAINAINWS